MIDERNALEDIERALKDPADSYIATPGNGDPAHNRIVLDLHESTIETIRAALTRLSEIEPIIQELVEARKKATPGFWQHRNDAIYGPQFESGVERKIAEMHWCGGNGPFIALAANRIAKIGGVDG